MPAETRPEPMPAADQGIEAQQRWRAMTREYSLESVRHRRLLLMQSCCGCRDRGPFMPNRIGGSNEGRPQAGRKTGEKQHRGTEGPIDNASVSCNEKGKEVENRARDQKRVPFEQPVALRMTVHHYHHHHVVLTPGLCRSILSAFVLQLSMRFAWCELCVDVLRSVRTVRLTTHPRSPAWHRRLRKRRQTDTSRILPPSERSKATETKEMWRWNRKDESSETLQIWRVPPQRTSQRLCGTRVC